MADQYYTIKVASEILGVTPLTLRNWDKAGKLVAYRHPLNNYRMYKREQIDEIVDKLGRRRDTKKKIQIEMLDEAPEVAEA
ncbi:MAG: MerR family DNA-binding transcriptional regulator [Patescibacteria group bacterium]